MKKGQLIDRLNQPRSPAHCEKLAEINRKRRNDHIEAGIVSADAAQEAKNNGIEIEELTK